MRKLALILALGFVTSIGFAQSRNDLKGPAAKNFKPWKNNYPKSTLLVTTSRDNLKGPEAKNYKLHTKENAHYETSRVVMGRKKNLKGPRAKNAKPWTK